MILVSNDFPPKVGGIQNYLFELWSRLPLTNTKVITTKYDGDKAFDANLDFAVDRYSKILWPTPKLIKHVNATINEFKSDVVFIDPLLPTGLITSKIKGASKISIIHGAEVTVPGRLLPSRVLIRKSVQDSDVILSAGNYAARELVRAIGRPINMVRIPPGVDIHNFYVPSDDQKVQAKESIVSELGLEKDSRILVSMSRLVPRKGFDVAIKSLAGLEQNVHLIIIGKGRDLKRLQGLVEKLGLQKRVHFLGSVSHQKMLSVLHSADLFLMLCRDRWASLEAEGFGIVFLEAQSCGLPVIVGRSGGSSESLIDEKTGFLVDSESPTEIREKINKILSDDKLSKEFSAAGRAFVEKEHSYDYLATLLLPLVNGDLSSAKNFDG
jgi:phosphatidylinositol alpha-1,6-mannosyltransferase